MAEVIQNVFRRYAQLIEPAIVAAPFTAELEAPAAVQAERGVLLPICLRDPTDGGALAAVDRLCELAAGGVEALVQVDVIDRSGHRRPVYRPLLVYAWLQAYRLAYETLPRTAFGRWEEGLRVWCHLLEVQLTGIGWRDEGIPASMGGAIGAAAWAALALSAAGRIFVRDAWTDLAADAFGRLTRAQEPSGPFLRATSSDNPETRWFHELIVLHAAADYAVQTEDRNVASAVARATEFHLRETQPDHATNQPWGLFAFLWNADTRTLADQLLHAATVQQPSATDGVTSLLLADALYCLRLFL